jgi:hypothetical protein
MPKLDSISSQKYGFDNMRGNTVKNVGKPRQSTDALTFGIPNYTTTERDALNTDIVGNALIFNTTTSKLNFYDGTNWRVITST